MRLFNASFIHVLLGRSTLNSLERMANGEREKREGKEGLLRLRFTLQLKTLVDSIYDVSNGWGDEGPQKSDERNKIR